MGMNSMNFYFNRKFVQAVTESLSLENLDLIPPVLKMFRKTNRKQNLLKFTVLFVMREKDVKEQR